MVEYFKSFDEVMNESLKVPGTLFKPQNYIDGSDFKSVGVLRKKLENPAHHLSKLKAIPKLNGVAAKKLSNLLAKLFKDVATGAGHIDFKELNTLISDKNLPVSIIGDLGELLAAVHAAKSKQFNNLIKDNNVLASDTPELMVGKNKILAISFPVEGNYPLVDLFYKGYPISVKTVTKKGNVGNRPSVNGIFQYIKRNSDGTNLISSMFGDNPEVTKLIDLMADEGRMAEGGSALKIATAFLEVCAPKTKKLFLSQPFIKKLGIKKVEDLQSLVFSNLNLKKFKSFYSDKVENTPVAQAHFLKVRFLQNVIKVLNAKDGKEMLNFIINKLNASTVKIIMTIDKGTVDMEYTLHSTSRWGFTTKSEANNPKTGVSFNFGGTKK